MVDIEKDREWMRRATSYELLSLAFLTPNVTIAEALSTGAYADACEEAFFLSETPALAEAAEHLASYGGLSQAEVLQRIRKEHTRLFLSLGSSGPLVTPYVGVRASERNGGSGLLFVGEESRAIERFMRRCGVAKDLSAGQINEPMDHIGSVCEFLEYLCLANARAIELPPSAEVVEEDYGRFMAEHLAEYPDWLDLKIRELSREPLYLAATMLLNSLVAAR